MSTPNCVNAYPMQTDVHTIMYRASTRYMTETEEAETRTYTVEEIRERITTQPQWTAHALLALYQHQTNDEQRLAETRHRNAQGFNSVDAPLLSSFAQQLRRGRTLSPKQLVYAQRKLRKYAKQLHTIAYTH